MISMIIVIKSHLQKHGRRIEESDQKHREVYNCDHYEKKYKGTEILKQHKSSHHRKTNCPCDQCGKTFEESHTLTHHNSSYHETNVYPCNQYEKTSNESGTLKQH